MRTPSGATRLVAGGVLRRFQAILDLLGSWCALCSGFGPVPGRALPWQRSGSRYPSARSMVRFISHKKSLMDNPQPQNNPPDWERKTLEKLLFSTLEEQKTRRRWGIFFRFLGFGYLALVLVALVDWSTEASHQERHTALIDLTGVIESKGSSNAEKLIESLQSAFKEKNVAGVILRINSPGGSPVQSGIINDEIHRLRAKHPETPLYAVVEDICASGGYYVAVAADKIYVEQGEHRRFDRRPDGRFRVHRHDGKAGCRSPLADGGQQQGFPRSLLAAESEPDGARSGHARRHPSAVHRRGQGRTRRAPQGNARDVLRTRCGPATRASSLAWQTTSAA